MFNEHSPWSTTFDFQAMSCVLGLCIFVCSGDEGDDEILEGCKELRFSLT
jgi:hypothetical protein